MSDNSIITRKAKYSLAGRWPDAILTTIVYFVVISLLSCTIIGEILVWPISLGWLYVCLKFVRQSNESPRIKDLVVAFYDGKTFIVSLLAGIFISVIVGIGLILLIVPGIYFACRYSMTFFIIVDNPGIGAIDAMSLSSEIMNGKTWKFFCLNCRFIGWILLSIMTFGLGFIFVTPYLYCSYAVFYDEAYSQYNARKAGEAFLGA